MDMEKQVATKIALTAVEKVQVSDYWEDIRSEVDWKKLEQLISEDNFDELFQEHLKDSESFIRMMDKLYEEVEAEIKGLESYLMI